MTVLSLPCATTEKEWIKNSSPTFLRDSALHPPPQTAIKASESVCPSAKPLSGRTAVRSQHPTIPTGLNLLSPFQKKRRTIMSKCSVLIIEDEKNIQTFMGKILKRQEYRVLYADTGAQGLEIIRSQCPDIILLDLGLPDMNGFEIIREVRTWTSTPIIVISARTAEQEKVSALDLGADDYITKPFGTSELLARIRASLRHSNRLRTDSPLYLRPYRHGEMKLDFSKRLLTIGSQVVHLTPIEYKIVAYLAQNSGKVITY